MFLLLALTACAVVQGSGVSAEEARDVTGVTALKNNTFVDVHWLRADEASATLTCDDNLLGYIETRLDGGELVIRTEPYNAVLSPEVDCVLELASPCLSALSFSGSGDFIAGDATCGLEQLSWSGSGNVDLGEVGTANLDIHGSGSGQVRIASLEAGALSFDLSGSGGVDVQGAADSADVHVSGSGSVDGRDLQVIDADVDMSSSGEVHLRASGHVTAHLSGSGSLHLYGEPERLDQDTSGSGGVVIH